MSAVPHPTPTGLLVLQIADLLDIPWLLLPLDGRSVCRGESRLEEEQGALDLRLNKGPVTKSSLNGTVLVPIMTVQVSKLKKVGLPQARES